MFRFIVPGIFAVLTVLLLAVYILTAGGHGSNPFVFVAYLMYPACFLTTVFEQAVGGPEIVWLALCIVLSGLQYFLIGYAIDVFVKRRRQGKQT